MLIEDGEDVDVAIFG